MISAQEASNAIARAELGLRKDEERIDAILAQAASEIAGLRQEQAELFRSLARIRLDSLRQRPVIGHLDEAESQAMAILREQQQRVEELARRREALGREITAAGEARAERAEAVRKAADAIDALIDATQARLAETVDWQAQAARLTGAEARAEAAEEKAGRAEADRDEKSRPYLADPLFVYLWQRGYGTSRYRAGPITRLGDNFVARVVNYEPARQNYHSLTEIPRRLREHAERLKGEVEEEAERLGELERAALEAEGIVRLEAQLQSAEQELDTAEERLAALEAELATIERERLDLLGEGGERGLTGAMEALAGSLQRADLRQLMRDAMETPTPEDERIVRRLQEIDEAVARRDQEVEEARRAAISLAQKRAELERSRDEFRHAGYERQGGGFANDKLIGDILGGIIGGVLSSRELRDALRSGYRPGRSSGPTLPRPGGTIFGSPGRGSGSSGRRGGGGFRTGGRF